MKRRRLSRKSRGLMVVSHTKRPGYPESTQVECLPAPHETREPAIVMTRGMMEVVPGMLQEGARCADSTFGEPVMFGFDMELVAKLGDLVISDSAGRLLVGRYVEGDPKPLAVVTACCYQVARIR